MRGVRSATSCSVLIALALGCGGHRSASTTHVAPSAPAPAPADGDASHRFVVVGECRSADHVTQPIPGTDCADRTGYRYVDGTWELDQTSSGAP